MAFKNIKSKKIKGLKILSAFFLTGFLISGCATVGPDYAAPKIELSPEWQTLKDPAIQPGEKVVRQWWRLFNDPLLNRLIAAESGKNLDFLSAVARVEEVKARLGVAVESQYPSVDVNSSATRQRTSENLSGESRTTAHYLANMGANWEIDLFGRVRRSIEAAGADYQASVEDQTDVLISLYGHICRTYLSIRTNQARIASARANIKSQKEMLSLTSSRFKHGLATDLDVAQAQRLLARAQAEVPPLTIAIYQGINNLSVLLGQQPGPLFEILQAPGPIPLPPARVTIGVPANLLRQRPDIRKAERELASQTAKIGIATADLYPSFSLNGTWGFESLSAGDLFESGSKVFSIGPSLRWEIFSRDRIHDQIKAQSAVARQYLFAYEKTVINALREVEDALQAYTQQRVRLLALERSVAAAQRSVTLATRLYKKGLVDFQPVLDAQRDQFDFESQLAAARGDAAVNFAKLNTALGGGWDPGQI